MPPVSRTASPKQQIPFPTMAPTTLPPTTAPTTRGGGGSAGGVYVEDFTKPLSWALWADAEGFIGLTSYKDDPAMGFVLPPTWGLISFVLEQGFADIDISGTATVALKPEEYAVGVFCRGQGKARYEFLVGDYGSYSIWKSDTAGKYTNLTPGGKWALSDAVPQDFDEITVGARCRGDQLTLLVDGKEIATVRDRSITGSGSAGLVTNNFDENKPARIFFDDIEFRL